MSPPVAASGAVSWTRVRVPTLLSRIAKGLYVFGQLGSLGTILGVPFVAVVAIPGMLAYPALIVSYIMSLSQSTIAGGVEIDGSDLVVHTGGRRAVFPLAHVAGALVVERESFGARLPTVEIEMNDGDRLTLHLRDPMQARAVVNALGFGPGGRAIKTTLTKPTRRLLHPAIAIFAYFVGMTTLGLSSFLIGRADSWFAASYSLYPIVVVALFELVKRLIRPPVTTVGEDGVAYTHRWRTRFVARRDLDHVGHADGASMVLVRKDGSRIALASHALDHARVAAVARAIDERSPPDAASPDRLAHYGRGSGMGIADWRTHLQRALNQEGYRATAAPAEEALAVLRSPGATPEQRVGAAMAARVAGIPPERIRIAADATADERVRVALEAVADDREDAVIEKAMVRMQR